MKLSKRMSRFTAILSLAALLLCTLLPATALATAGTVETATSSGVTSTGATLSVSFDVGAAPDATITAVGFQYGTDNTFATNTTGVWVYADATAVGTNTSASKTLTGLTPSTTYHYRAMYKTSANQTPQYSASGSFTTPAAPLTVTTADATNVTTTTATIGGSYVVGTAAVTGCGVKYYETAVPGTVITVNSATVGTPITANLTNLKANTEYTYYAFANDGAEVKGTTKTFTTSAVATPTVVTGTPSVSGTSVSLNGQANSVTGSTFSSARFYYRAVGATSWAVKQATLNTTSGAISASLSGLNANTTYEVYAQGTLQSGTTVDGTTLQFTTGGTTSTTAPTVYTGNASSVTAYSATLSGSYVTGSLPITYTGFEVKLYNSLSYSTYYSDYNSGTSFNTTVSNLPSGTYNYRAFVVTSNGSIYYGSVNTFTTGSNTGYIPTVYTYSASSVTSSTAVLNGAYSIGSKPILYKGFELRNINASAYTRYTVSTTSTSMTLNLTGLSGTYLYRAFVTTADGTYYGSDVTFTTGTASVSASVTSVAATNIGANYAQLNGSVAGTSIMKAGFQVRKSGGSWGDVIWNSATSGSYATIVTGLKSGTTYTFRTVAMVPGTGSTAAYIYGSELAFVTSGSTSSGSGSGSSGSTGGDIPKTGNYDAYYAGAMLLACGLIVALTAMKRKAKA